MTTIITPPARDTRWAAQLAQADPGLDVSDVAVRRVPRGRWGGTVMATVLLTVVALAGWEMKMRSLGLAAGDLDDSNDHWAVARRSLATGSENKIAIVGDSRIWFDTDLAVWEEMTGTRPVQLAVEGTNGRYFLSDLAADERFTGLAVVGLAEMLFFATREGLRFDAIERGRTQSYAQRWGVALHTALSRRVAFLDQMYTPQRLIRTLDLPSRPRVITPRMMPWKLAESFDDRQTFMWPRVVTDHRLRDATRNTWMGLITFAMPPVTSEVVDLVIADAVRDVQRIRARGGEVVFVRPPSGGALLDAERKRLPRTQGWDRLLLETGAVGIHWEDHAAMQGLDVPEWSHLSRESATRYTRAYVDVLMREVPWLQSRVSGWKSAKVN
jgi:hypothetical protein